jgi:hypothetical protein
MSRNMFMGWLLIILALAVLAGMFYGIVKWWGIVDIFVAIVWMAGGVVFLRKKS